MSLVIVRTELSTAAIPKRESGLSKRRAVLRHGVAVYEEA
jgi:hypothetical protein